MPREPLFILAPPRSFTSVVCAMLGQHPSMYGLPEVNLFQSATFDGLQQLYRLRHGFRHGLLRAVAQLGLGGQSSEDIEAAKAWLEENGNVGTDALFNDLATWAGARSLVDKSPSYVYGEGSLERIRAAFPGARYLHLTRHPAGTCESILRLREKIAAEAGGSRAQLAFGRVEDPDRLWLEPHRRIMRFLERVPAGQWMRLRGEDILADPDQSLPGIAKWLDVDDSPEAIGLMQRPELSPFAALGPINAKYGNDPEFLRNPALRPYRPKQLSLSEHLPGYPDIYFSAPARNTAAAFGYEG